MLSFPVFQAQYPCYGVVYGGTWSTTPRSSIPEFPMKRRSIFWKQLVTRFIKTLRKQRFVKDADLFSAYSALKSVKNTRIHYVCISSVMAVMLKRGQ